jgi:ABC-type transport system involved in multi-copper enzyme maturation permease subunit
MLKVIIKKEILESILSLKYTICFAIIILLFVMSAAIHINTYKIDLTDYNKRVNEETIKVHSFNSSLAEFLNHGFFEIKKPSNRSFLARKAASETPNSIYLEPLQIYDYLNEKTPNYTSGNIFDTDFFIIIAIILSFLSIILTFDAACGEKINGTLKLMLSNSISKKTILFGKYIGVMLTLFIPIIIGIFVNLIIFNIYPIMDLSINDYLSVLMFLILSFLYLSFFVSLGIFISCLVNAPSKSINILLVIWTFLVIIIPQGGRIILDKFYKTESWTDVRLKLDMKRKEIGAEFTKKIEAYKQDEEKCKGKKARLKYEQEISIREQEEKIRQGFFINQIASVKSARSILKFSPYVIFQESSEILSGAGLDAFLNFYHQIEDYKKTLLNFIINEDKKDPDSYHIISNWQDECMSQKPVKANIIPLFIEKEQNFLEYFNSIIINIAILFLFSVVFLCAAFIVFIRYDVR